MGKVFEEITPDLQGWIQAQHMFFVATAPMAEDGLVNCSPKGMDTFRIIGPNEVAYLDLTGSGAETIAHLKENGRMVFMFCAFTGAPKIVRLHGQGTAITPNQSEFAELKEHFPELTGTRSIISCKVQRVSDSCGYSLPRYDYVGERDTLTKWAQAKGDAGLSDYRREKNSASLDGLPALAADES
ncbi:MAG: pyridoxamine 5'-phosphate oxidase family protein [Gemmatimonadetes bacterium]|jgi:hypothetical protein|nr:pyridoxamine 5'-phosphate oxidase family protein [Gemmatimonadota bacterium]MBT7860621.1 pyridoxamine 5'-phosphate oxidase family protein [Gemmatimonadota bacterium]